MHAVRLNPSRSTVANHYRSRAISAVRVSAARSIAFLPFTAAMIVWWLALATAIAAGAWALSVAVKRPFLVGYAAFALSLGLTCFSEGNVMPLSVAAITVGRAFGRGECVASTWPLAIAMIEPTIALPSGHWLLRRVPKCASADRHRGLDSFERISVLAGGVALQRAVLRYGIAGTCVVGGFRDNQDTALSQSWPELGAPRLRGQI